MITHRMSHRHATTHLQRVHVRLLRDTLHVQAIQRPQVDPPPPRRLEGEGQRQ